MANPKDKIDKVLTAYERLRKSTRPNRSGTGTPPPSPPPPAPSR